MVQTTAMETATGMLRFRRVDHLLWSRQPQGRGTLTGKQMSTVTEGQCSEGPPCPCPRSRTPALRVQQHRSLHCTAWTRSP
jgi:hypothetical protein